MPLTEQAVALIGFSIVHAPQFIFREAGVIRHDLNPSSEQVVEGHFYITIGFLECLAALLKLKAHFHQCLCLFVHRPVILFSRTCHGRVVIILSQVRLLCGLRRGRSGTTRGGCPTHTIVVCLLKPGDLLDVWLPAQVHPKLLKLKPAASWFIARAKLGKECCGGVFSSCQAALDAVEGPAQVYLLTLVLKLDLEQNGLFHRVRHRQLVDQIITCMHLVSCPVVKVLPFIFELGTRSRYLLHSTILRILRSCCLALSFLLLIGLHRVRSMHTAMKRL